MPGQRLPHRGNLLGRHIAGLIAALVPALELVEGRMAGTAGLLAELAPFHAGDGVDFPGEFLGDTVQVSCSISILLDTKCQKKSRSIIPFELYCNAPSVSGR